MENTNSNNFWRNNCTYRNTNSGINENVISQKNPNCSSKSYINYLKLNNTSILLSSINNVTEYHIKVLKTCLNELENDKSGYLYNIEQLKNFIAICRNMNIRAVYNPNDNVWEITKI